MTEAETRARAQAYGLFSRLVMRGLDEETLPLVQELTPLGDALPTTIDADELAAGHHDLFGMQVFPYGSVYLDPEGRPGGAVSEAAADFYRQIGFGPPLGEVTADHLAVELGALSFLLSAEADALRDGDHNAVARCRDAAGGLVRDHLALWLAPFVAAVKAETVSFWTVVVELVVELVASHAVEASMPVEAGSATAGSLLDAPDTGIKQIAAFLCSPVDAGTLFTRRDIERFGRALSVPTGFGTRVQRMQVLFESAAQYDAVGQLCEVLRAELQARELRLADLPPVVARDWPARMRATDKMLERLASLARRLT